MLAKNDSACAEKIAAVTARRANTRQLNDMTTAFLTGEAIENKKEIVKLRKAAAAAEGRQPQLPAAAARRPPPAVAGGCQPRAPSPPVSPLEETPEGKRGGAAAAEIAAGLVVARSFLTTANVNEADLEWDHFESAAAEVAGNQDWGFTRFVVALLVDRWRTLEHNRIRHKPKIIKKLVAALIQCGSLPALHPDMLDAVELLPGIGPCVFLTLCAAGTGKLETAEVFMPVKMEGIKLLERVRCGLTGISKTKYGKEGLSSLCKLLTTACNCHSEDHVTVNTKPVGQQPADGPNQVTVSCNILRLVCSMAVKEDLGSFMVRGQFDVKSKSVPLDRWETIALIEGMTTRPDGGQGGQYWPSIPTWLALFMKSAPCVFGGITKALISLIQGGHYIKGRTQCTAPLYLKGGNRSAANQNTTANSNFSPYSNRGYNGGDAGGGGDALSIMQPFFVNGAQLKGDWSLKKGSRDRNQCAGNPLCNFQCSASASSGTKMFGFTDDCEPLFCGVCVLYVKGRVHKYDANEGEILPQKCSIVEDTATELLKDTDYTRKKKTMFSRKVMLAKKVQFSDKPIYALHKRDNMNGGVCLVLLEQAPAASIDKRKASDDQRTERSKRSRS